MYRCVSLQGRNSLRPAAEAAQHNSTSTFFSKTNVFTCSRSAHHPALPHHQMAGVWCCSRPGLTTGGGQKEQTLSLTLRLCYRDHPGKIAGSSAVEMGCYSPLKNLQHLRGMRQSPQLAVGSSPPPSLTYPEAHPNPKLRTSFLCRKYKNKEKIDCFKSVWRHQAICPITLQTSSLSGKTFC